MASVYAPNLKPFSQSPIVDAETNTEIAKDYDSATCPAPPPSPPPPPPAPQCFCHRSCYKLPEGATKTCADMKSAKYTILDQWNAVQGPSQGNYSVASDNDCVAKYNCDYFIDYCFTTQVRHVVPAS